MIGSLPGGVKWFSYLIYNTNISAVIINRKCFASQILANGKTTMTQFIFKCVRSHTNVGCGL